MKFTKIILIALTLLAAISARTQRRSKVRVTNGDSNQDVVNYEASIEIKDDTNTEVHPIKINQDSFNHMSYGIQFSMEQGAITNDSFFRTEANTYFFNFQYAHEFNCLNQATFTPRQMFFSVNVNKKAYSITFTFPNGWAFGEHVNTLAVCSKFSEKWLNTQRKRSNYKSEIMQLFGHIMLLEKTRAANIKTKDQLKSQNADLDNMINQSNSTIIAHRQKIEQLNKEILAIEDKKNKEEDVLNNLDLQIKSLEAKLQLQQNFIDENNNKMASIKPVTQEEIDNEWDSYKINCKKTANFYSSEDPIKSKVDGLIGNVKTNYEAIEKAFVKNK